jgi:hypothetical protein
MTMSPSSRGLLGRGELIEEIESLLDRRRSVMLVGPPEVGKTALITALDRSDVMTLDPLERVSAHYAARIRRAMDRDVLCLAAVRSLNRAHLGSVRRIAFRFVTIQVRPLPPACMRSLIGGECDAAGMSGDVSTASWMRAAVEVARGRPGVALAIVRETARMWTESARTPTPAAAYLEASIRREVGSQRQRSGGPDVGR